MSRKLIRRIMKSLGKLMPVDISGERSRPVRIYGILLLFKDLFKGKLIQRWLNLATWPITSGTYIVSEPSAFIAICTLTSSELMEPLSKSPGVSITGELVTANLGIEKIILNTISNPNIRFLFLCGEESPVFHPAQTLRALFKYGIDEEKRVRKSEGHYAVLNNIDIIQIESFRKQVQLVDFTNETDPVTIQRHIEELKKEDKPPFEKKQEQRSLQDQTQAPETPDNQFKKIRPGGGRETSGYDPRGFFIISVDYEEGEIVVRHYLPDNTPAHEIRGKRAEAIIRGLIREDLISQVSHASYIGVELGKAETALRRGLPYEQDHPVKIE